MHILVDSQREPLERTHVAGMRTCAEVTESALRLQLQSQEQAPHVHSHSQSLQRTWPPGSIVGVSFIGGSDSMRTRVEQYATKWTDHANIVFDFDAPCPTAIRIAFIDDVGSWSFMGTSCELVRGDKPTMNLAWLGDDTPDDVFAGTVLHVFGHALGLVHEHVPGVRIEWNRSIVCGYFHRTQGWSEDDVQRNVFQHYESDRPQLRSATFDPRTIMLYPIPEQFTSGQSVGWNIQLSETDIQRIRQLYPPLSQFLDTGRFLTNSDRPNEPAKDTKGTIHFEVATDSWRMVPRVVLGVNWLDMERGRNTRLSCDVLDVAEDSAQINLRSWADTLQYSTGCSWLAVSSSDIYCQTGQYTVSEDWRFATLPVRTSHRVLFTHVYPAIPKVACWLSGMDCAHGWNLRLSIYATDITVSGFTLHLDTWADTRLLSLTATWLAHPADRADIISDTIDPEVDTPIRNPKQAFTGTVSFEKSPFTKPPRVFMAFNRLDIGNGENLSVGLVSGAVTYQGMNYTIQALGNAIMHSASCTYLAIV